MINQVLSVVGILSDEADPMVSVMKVDKAPLESYADVGGLEQQVQEIKEAVELPLTHPELYEDIGIKPPKVLRRQCCVFFPVSDFLMRCCGTNIYIGMSLLSGRDIVWGARNRKDIAG